MSNKIRVPSYRRHKPTNQAVVTLSGKDVYLGEWGTAASKQKYRQLVAKWLLNNQRPTGSDVTVTELVAKYWHHVERYYVKDGLLTSEQHCIKSALRPLLRLYETCLVEDFTPNALKTVRDEMIEAGWMRRTVNRQVDRIRRMFKWGVEEQLVPVTVSNALLCVSGLRKGRCSVRESQPVRPVDDATIEATLPHLTRTVADMVRVQRLTGMRPAEVCVMRPMDLDRSGDVWLYRPQSHKTEHHDKQHLIFVGPQAQTILLRYLARDSAMYCFRPIDSEVKRRVEQHANRNTPMNQGNRPGTNRRRRPKRTPGQRYTTASYAKAIERACDRRAMQAAIGQPFEPLPNETVGRWYKRLTGISRDILMSHLRKYRWSPNRLRHSAGTEIRRKFGLEAAQILLGHANADVTQVYAERDLSRGIEVARRIG